MNENANGSRRVNAESRKIEDQLVAGASCQIMPDTDAHVTHLHKAEEDAGRAILRAWVNHQQVRPIVEFAQPGADYCVAAVAEHLDSQTAVTLLILSALGLTPEWPDGSRAPDVLDPADGWPVTDDARAAVRTLLPPFLHAVAQQLAAAGVPLVPTYGGDLLVLGQMLLLDVYAEPDLDLATVLNVSGPTAFRSDGSGMPQIRVGRTARASRNADHYLEHLQARSGAITKVPKAVPTGGADRSATPQARMKAVRLNALRRTLVLYPDATAREISDTWSTVDERKPRPGRLYRQAFAEELGLNVDTVNRFKPDLRTLYRDFGEIAQ